MNNIVKIKGPDLASRNAAAILRRSILSQIDEHGLVSIDLSNVESISDSYTDELFGILAIENNLDWFSSHIKISGASDPILRNIASVIKRRLSSQQAA